MSGCKSCKSGVVELLTEHKNIKHKGKVLRVEVEYSLCHTCKREFLSTEQVMKNDRALEEAKTGLIIDKLLPEGLRL